MRRVVPILPECRIRPPEEGTEAIYGMAFGNTPCPDSCSRYGYHAEDKYPQPIYSAFEMKKIFFLFLLTLGGISLFASDYYMGIRGFWAHVDTEIFHYFNAKLVPDSFFVKFAAVTNVRVFDVVAFLAMGLLYFRYFSQAGNGLKRLMISRGLLMLAAAVAIKQAGRYLPISRPSPTLVFEGINRLSELTALPAKDYSGNSFPGDHGMMLMIFAAFIARYHGARAFLAASLLVVCFSMPRIISGAHWFSDVYAGSLSIVMVCCGWLLLTPAADRLSAGIEKLLPEKLYPAAGNGL